MHTRRFHSFSAFFALAAFVLAVFAAAPAAAQEAGYITEEILLPQMPEFQEAQQQLQQQMQSNQQQLQQQQQQLQQRVEKFQTQSEMMTEDSRQQRMNELRQQQQDLQQEMQRLQQQAAQRERQLLRPVIDRYRSAVAAVAEERGLDYVITEQALVYADDAQIVDVTDAVAARLNVDLDDVQQPLPETDAASMGSGGR